MFLAPAICFWDQSPLHTKERYFVEAHIVDIDAFPQLLRFTVVLRYRYQIEIDRTVPTKVTLPIDMPTFLSSILERNPLSLKACKLQIIEDLAITRVISVKHPLVRSTFITFRTGFGQRLERLAQGGW
jgi:hypothetical protein